MATEIQHSKCKFRKLLNGVLLKELKFAGQCSESPLLRNALKCVMNVD